MATEQMKFYLFSGVDQG